MKKIWMQLSQVSLAGAVRYTRQGCILHICGVAFDLEAVDLLPCGNNNIKRLFNLIIYADILGH